VIILRFGLCQAIILPENGYKLDLCLAVTPDGGGSQPFFDCLGGASSVSQPRGLSLTAKGHVRRTFTLAPPCGRVSAPESATPTAWRLREEMNSGNPPPPHAGERYRLRPGRGKACLPPRGSDHASRHFSRPPNCSVDRPPLGVAISACQDGRDTEQPPGDMNENQRRITLSTTARWATSFMGRQLLSS
jgi:hypothetical protein